MRRCRKMKILYVALSCGPNLGSEDAIGWNLPLEVSRIGHDVTVLTREDKRTEIEEYISKHPEDRYPTYKYVPLSKTAALCKGPLYSLRALIWCRSASKFVKHIASLEHFDVIHQITPVEFRAILDLREGGGKVLKNAGPRWRGRVCAKTAISLSKRRVLSRAVEAFPERGNRIWSIVLQASL